MHVVPQFHSSELSEQCFFPSHHSVRWTHWWLLQESSLSLHFAVEIHTHTHRENQHWGQQLCSVVHYLVERVTCKSHSSWPHPPAGGSLGNRHRSCWLWCTRYCRDTPTESALSSLTDTHTHTLLLTWVCVFITNIFLFSRTDSPQCSSSLWSSQSRCPSQRLDARTQRPDRHLKWLGEHSVTTKNNKRN